MGFFAQQAVKRAYSIRFTLVQHVFVDDMTVCSKQPKVLYEMHLLERKP